MLKSENGEEVGRKCTAAQDYDEHGVNLRRKSSNLLRQSQVGDVSSIYNNAHVPSASRQFTLASLYDDADAKSATVGVATIPAAAYSLTRGTANGSSKHVDDELVSYSPFLLSILVSSLSLFNVIECKKTSSC